MTEAQIQEKIIDRYEKDGYMVVKLIQTSKNGIPDLLLLKDGIASFIEVVVNCFQVFINFGL